MPSNDTMTRLQLSLQLSRRVLEPDYKGFLTLSDVQYRIEYWTKEVLKRVALFASDPRGW